MKNAEIAALFNEIADFLEIKGENPFRVRAYRRAAQAMEGLTEDVAAIAAREGLLEIPGIGKDLAAKIQEYLQRGRVEYLDELRKEIPPGVRRLDAHPWRGAEDGQAALRAGGRGLGGEAGGIGDGPQAGRASPGSRPRPRRTS